MTRTRIGVHFINIAVPVLSIGLFLSFGPSLRWNAVQVGTGILDRGRINGLLFVFAVALILFLFSVLIGKYGAKSKKRAFNASFCGALIPHCGLFAFLGTGSLICLLPFLILWGIQYRLAVIASCDESSSLRIED
jgi:hypothetical protein